ncbi:dTDP-4-dehydrorhamnose 3,5-epimerase [Algibacter amylolyticus]|uniref:dTDP-4-dehydrorhamnose 3,5-epimerase n=1 Tax=Algibacter amylolyticus TaxID=1608400 RepID=A0A5M7BCK1_9FLAO|nr:dTDP-4-dehydrorhamnose 3,5-epimerase [Algibacter amylolyticus]KAA5827423.1 dTDP-4-dehydrorhamnose 3,5-epimerase [Algibacter amylolyticus]MBB5266615.1 dTDP-4-dehydrorhamnose 3,5-epimerase [Algibacter amylolyticus]TSJ81668.1 dTDP-4-dehydrorhamnose 3,5-epimerase [Algibacter amylolyticus]
MEIAETYLKGCFVITPKMHKDERGYFLETFNEKIFFKTTGIKNKFVQDNLSKSSKGVLRGLHFQKGNTAQAKLVQVISGKVLDVCVDLRKDSPTFGKHFSILLDCVKKQQLYVPRGFAHGFIVLENNTVFSYKCDNYYDKSSESGIIFNDKFLNIDWGFSEDKMIVSEKDKNLLTFKSLFKC